MKRTQCTSLLGMSALAVLLTSCGRQEQADFYGAPTAVPFAKWCSTSGSSKCTVPETKPIPQAEWDAGLAATAVVLESPSTILLTRKDYDNVRLQSLFTAFGAGDVLSLIRSLPWNSLTNDLGGFVLQNDVDGAVVEFNGLKLRGAKKIQVKLVGKQIRISGVTLVEPKATRVVQSLGLTKAGLVDVNTDSLIISGVPVGFFASSPIIKPASRSTEAAMDVGTIVKAISELALDDDFAWRGKITLLLRQTQLAKLNSIRSTLGPRDPVAGSVMDVIAASDHVLFGGASTVNVLSVSRKNPVVCKFKVTNIPILGKMDLNLNFASGFGMAGLRRGTGDVLAQIDSYGIETNFGKVKGIEVKKDQMVLSVGVVKIPIDYVPKSQTNGPRVESGSCTEGPSLAMK